MTVFFNTCMSSIALLEELHGHGFVYSRQRVVVTPIDKTRAILPMPSMAQVLDHRLSQSIVPILHQAELEAPYHEECVQAEAAKCGYSIHCEVGD